MTALRRYYVCWGRGGPILDTIMAADYFDAKRQRDTPDWLRGGNEYQPELYGELKLSFTLHPDPDALAEFEAMDTGASESDDELRAIGAAHEWETRGWDDPAFVRYDVQPERAPHEDDPRLEGLGLPPLGEVMHQRTRRTTAA